jgi:hypothetical protein
MLKMIPDRVVNKLIKERIRPIVQHDHDPSNDAEVMYRKYLLALELKERLRSFVY